MGESLTAHISTDNTRLLLRPRLFPGGMKRDRMNSLVLYDLGEVTGLYEAPIEVSLDHLSYPSMEV